MTRRMWQSLDGHGEPFEIPIDKMDSKHLKNALNSCNNKAAHWTNVLLTILQAVKTDGVEETSETCLSNARSTLNMVLTKRRWLIEEILDRRSRVKQLPSEDS